jgi:Ser/Thr protein kinase RdoA (MazF antagonist)
LFDFDDSAYDLFISDLAIPLFYVVLMLPEDQDPVEFGSNFLKHSLAGYRETNDLDSDWLRHIPLILKRRTLS